MLMNGLSVSMNVTFCGMGSWPKKRPKCEQALVLRVISLTLTNGVWRAADVTMTKQQKWFKIASTKKTIHETIMAFSWQEKWTTLPFGNLTKVPWFLNFFKHTGHESISVRVTFWDSTRIRSSWTCRYCECIRPRNSCVLCRCETLFSMEASRKGAKCSSWTPAGVLSRTVIRSIWKNARNLILFVKLPEANSFNKKFWHCKDRS